MLRTTLVAPGRDARRHGGSALFVNADRAAARISIDDLMLPAAYDAYRRSHRHLLIAHRRSRALRLGPRMRLHFEDRQTVLYQIHAVLRAERAENLDDAQHEIDAYAHLVPDGTQWKATLSIECVDAVERARELPQLSRAADLIPSIT